MRDGNSTTVRQIPLAAGEEAGDYMLKAVHQPVMDDCRLWSAWPHLVCVDAARLLAACHQHHSSCSCLHPTRKHVQIHSQGECCAPDLCGCRQARQLSVTASGVMCPTCGLYPDVDSIFCGVRYAVSAERYLWAAYTIRTRSQGQCLTLTGLHFRLGSVLQL